MIKYVKRSDKDLAAYNSSFKKANTAYDKLKKEIDNKETSDVYLFYGDEKFLIERYVDSICGLLLEGDTAMLNKVVLDEETDPGKIVAEAENMPFFAEKRVVIVLNSGQFKKGESDKKIQAYFEEPHKSTCLIFVESKAVGNSKAVNFLKKCGGLAVNFEYRSSDELEAWMGQYISKRGKSISYSALTYFIAISDESMHSIQNEADKLLLFIGDRPEVMQEDIDAICTKTIKSLIFDMTQAMLTGNKKAAIYELDKMLVNKEEPIAIIGFLSSHLYKLLRVMELSQKRMNPKNIALETGISDYYIRNLIKQSKSTTIPNIQQALEMCHDLDVKSKSTSEDIRTALETFIIQF